MQQGRPCFPRRNGDYREKIPITVHPTDSETDIFHDLYVATSNFVLTGGISLFGGEVLLSLHYMPVTPPPETLLGIPCRQRTEPNRLKKTCESGTNLYTGALITNL